MKDGLALLEVLVALRVCCVICCDNIWPDWGTGGTGKLAFMLGWPWNDIMGIGIIIGTYIPWGGLFSFCNFFLFFFSFLSFLFKASLLSSSELDEVVTELEDDEEDEVLGYLRWCFLFFFLDFLCFDRLDSCRGLDLSSSTSGGGLFSLINSSFVSAVGPEVSSTSFGVSWAVLMAAILLATSFLSSSNNSLKFLLLEVSPLTTLLIILLVAFRVASVGLM